MDKENRLELEVGALGKKIDLISYTDGYVSMKVPSYEYTLHPDDQGKIVEFLNQARADTNPKAEKNESALEIGREVVEHFIRDMDRMMKAMLAERFFNFDPEYVLAAQGSNQEPQEDREPWLWLRQVKTLTLGVGRSLVGVGILLYGVTGRHIIPGFCLPMVPGKRLRIGRIGMITIELTREEAHTIIECIEDSCDERGFLRELPCVEQGIVDKLEDGILELEMDAHPDNLGAWVAVVGGWLDP